MKYRGFWIILLSLTVSVPLTAQISHEARFEILHTVIAEQGSARIGLPFGQDGIELSDAGQINQEKLDKDIKKNGQSVTTGKVVTVTAIAFDDNKIEIELDGGGKNKKSIFERIQVGVGSGTQQVPVGKEDKTKQAKGSKVVLKFAKKVPPDLTPQRLKELLDPILDFNKRNFLKTGIDALPTEFQEAVKVKEARIGMDRSTVIMALGRPDQKSRDKDNEGIATETWLYYGKGFRAQFVTFQDDVVVRIKNF